MKPKSFTRACTAFAICLLFSGTSLHAEEPTAPAQSHDEHHPEGQAKETSKGKEMKSSMHMEEMMDHMNECKKMHMDGKMCDHQMMEKCQKKMGKGECQKMMKEAKANEKTTKTK